MHWKAIKFETLKNIYIYIYTRLLHIAIIQDTIQS